MLEVHHDENFNNIARTIEQSILAAAILKHPELTGRTIYKLVDLIANILKSEDSNALREFIKNDCGKAGQLAQIKEDEFEGILTTQKMTPFIFCQKIQIFRSFGSFLTDRAFIKQSDAPFLTRDEHISVSAYMKKPSDCRAFSPGYRGRTPVISFSERDDTGIMGKKTVDEILSPEDKKAFFISGLKRMSPLFRTRITGADGEKSPFIEKSVDNDEPLIASLSGCARSAKLASEILLKRYADEKKKGYSGDMKLLPEKMEQMNEHIVASVASLLICGGFHSEGEIMPVMKPKGSLKQLFCALLPDELRVYYQNIIDKYRNAHLKIPLKNMSFTWQKPV